MSRHKRQRSPKVAQEVKSEESHILGLSATEHERSKAPRKTKRLNSKAAHVPKIPLHNDDRLPVPLSQALMPLDALAVDLRRLNKILDMLSSPIRTKPLDKSSDQRKSLKLQTDPERLWLRDFLELIGKPRKGNHRS